MKYTDGYKQNTSTELHTLNDQIIGLEATVKVLTHEIAQAQSQVEELQVVNQQV